MINHDGASSCLVAWSTGSDFPSGQYVVAVESPYPGDFTLSGRHWRGIEIVVADTPEEALGRHRERKLDDGRRFLATDYPPAFDVIVARRSHDASS